MRILMVGNIASIGHNLRKGLREKGITCDMICGKEIAIVTGNNDVPSGSYDLIHIHSPVDLGYWLNWDFIKRVFVTRTVTHWHGSDLRQKNPLKRFLSWYFLKRSKAIFYSTKPLRKYLPNSAIWLPSPVDTDLFKPMKSREENVLIWGRAKIPHEKAPEYLNRFKKCEIIYAEGAEGTLSLSFLEALACGLIVKGHEKLNRDYVVKTHSIPVVTKKLMRIYERILGHENPE